MLFAWAVALMDLEGAVPEAEVREEMARRAAGWEPPAGPFVAVSAGYGFTCGLRLDGEVACWGYFAREEPRIPLEIYAEVYGPRLWDFYEITKVQTEAGVPFFDPRFYALYESLYGARVWELDPAEYLIAGPAAIPVESMVADLELVDPPSGPFIAIQAGWRRVCGLRPDGEIACSGIENEGSTPPPGPFATKRSPRPPRPGSAADNAPTGACSDSGGALGALVGQRRPLGRPRKRRPRRRQRHQLHQRRRRHRQLHPRRDQRPVRTTNILVLTRGRRRLRWVWCVLLVVVVGVACSGAEIAADSSGRGSEQRDLPEGPAVPADHGELPKTMDAAGALSGLMTTPHPFESCGLRPDGEVACWGTNWFGQVDAPAGPFVAIDAGASHSCGLRPDGSVTCWGEDSLDAAVLTDLGGFEFGGDEQAYVADQRHEQASMADLLEALGDSGSPVEPSLVALMDLEGAVPEAELREEMARRAQGWEPPAGPFVAVSAGYGFTCGLRLDGEVACWGYFAREEPRIPLEIYAEVYDSRLWDFHDLIKGQVALGGTGFYPEFYPLYESLYGARVWELDPVEYLIAGPAAIPVESMVADLELIAPPSGPFIAIQVGWRRTCGLRPDGELDCWGLQYEDSTPPPGAFATAPITPATADA